MYKNSRVHRVTRPYFNFDGIAVRTGRPGLWSGHEGGWTRTAAARVHRASVQNTSAALSCKYHQQLVARKLVVPNESLAYMWRGPSSAFLPTASIEVQPFCKALLMDCEPFNWTVMRPVFVPHTCTCTGGSLICLVAPLLGWERICTLSLCVLGSFHLLYCSRDQNNLTVLRTCTQNIEQLVLLVFIQAGIDKET